MDFKFCRDVSKGVVDVFPGTLESKIHQEKRCFSFFFLQRMDLSACEEYAKTVWYRYSLEVLAHTHLAKTPSKAQNK